MRKGAHAVPAVAVGLGLIVAGAAPPKVQAATDTAPELEHYADLVEEVELRRRVNVLFPNRQTLFDGLQVGFVNVSSGNLTFQRRDLVVLDGAPVVFARVYDSRLKSSEDLGRGWRLSLAEELVFDDELVLHVDSASLGHRFRLAGDRYVPDPPSPPTAGRSIILAAGGATALVVDADGTERVFQRSTADASRYRIVRHETPLRTLEFHYTGGLLSAVTSGGRTLYRIHREATDPRVRAVTDTHGRTVEYLYGRNGQLKEVVDLAGNA